MSSYSNSSPQGDINSNPNPNLTESKGHKVSSYNNSSPQGDINGKFNPNPYLKENSNTKANPQVTTRWFTLSHCGTPRDVYQN